MFALVDPLGVLLRTAVVYIAVLFALRVAGKREVGQMTTFDFVTLLLLANAVQNAMVGQDSSVLGGLLAALTLLLMNAGIAWARLRFPKLRSLIEGSPTLIVWRGKILKEALDHEEIDRDTLFAAFREHGVLNEKDVEMAVLEADGSISVVPKSNLTPRRTPHSLRYLKRGSSQ